MSRARFCPVSSPVSSAPVTAAPRTQRRRLVVALAPLLLGLLAAFPASAQSFAAGGGAFLLNDTGSVEKASTFGTWGGHIFGEVQLEPWVMLQLRASRFTLPGTITGAPNLETDAIYGSALYLFREDWFSAGFFGGIGYYRLKPKDLEIGQTPVDSKESVIGLHLGILTRFEVTPKVDLRIELAGHLIRTEVEHKPILLGASVAYHF